MNSTAVNPNAVPRSLLLAMAALVVASLVGVATVRLSGAVIHEPDAGTRAARSLRFEDGADGSVAIIDGHSGVLLDRVQGEAGFLRGALRALARERRKLGLGSEAPFDLIARNDGRLTLADSATGQRIDLESFGATNAGTFARLLTVQSPTAGPSSGPTTRSQP
jgi:putative photosynthetic complex assembly protein